MKSDHIVEAALFSAGRPVAVEEIVETTGLTKKQVQKAIDTLRKTYEERDTVLEIGKAGTKWGMQVRRQAAEPAAKFAPMEIPAKLLKTLALIAYHQPMKQSDLSEMVGSRVYDHVPELKDRGLVKTRRDGQTKILSTTALFPEYFGLDAATPEEIRTALAKAVGLDPKAEAKKRGQLEGYNEAAPAPVPDEGTTGEAVPGNDVPDEAAPGGATPDEAVQHQATSDEDGPQDAGTPQDPKGSGQEPAADDGGEPLEPASTAGAPEAEA